MSIITTYPNIVNVSGEDLLIISDMSIIGTPTRTVRVDQLVGDGSGSVLSVDASIGGNAVTVTGGPITVSGVLEFEFGGLSTQYIDGEGNLANFPSPSGALYNFGSSAIGNAIGLVLAGSDGSSDVVKINQGAGITLTDNGSNTFTIAATGGGITGLTSVGLSTDIQAFTIGNSPLVQNGVLTLNKTGGSEGQFLRQDGVWADVPSTPGGITQIIGQFPIDAVTANGTTTISLDSGWDILPYDGGNSTWDVEKYNGYMEVPAGVSVPSGVNIRPSGLEKANEGYFIFVATSADIPEDFLNFTSVNNGAQSQVKTTWSATGTRTYIPKDPLNGFWRVGTAVKFHYIFKDGVIYWSACCEIVTGTTSCAVIQGNSTVTHIMNENTAANPTSFSGGLPAGDGGSGLPMTWTIVTQPQHGTVVLDAATGDYVYTPNQDYDGNDSFEWKANNGICDSAIGTVNFIIQNVVDRDDPPTLYYESNGFGNPCGLVETPDPTVQPAVGFSGVLWEGHYCDPDSTVNQVIIGVTYSTDGGTTWLPLTGSAFTFEKDMIGGVVTPNRFTLSTTNFPSGTIKFKFTIEDQTPNIGVDRIVTFSAVYDFLISTEFLLSYSSGDPTGTQGAITAASYPAGTWTPPSTAYYDTLFEFPAATIMNESVNTYTGSVTNGALAPATTPDGGTLVAKYPNVKVILQKFQVTGNNPNQTVFDPEFKVMIEEGSLVTTSNNIVPGDTIVFNASTLDSMFSNIGSTGSIEYTIAVDDIIRAPLATGPVDICKELQMAGHSCSDGAFALIAWGYDASGTYRSFKLTRFNSSNSSQNTPAEFNDTNVTNQIRWSNPTYEFPYPYISREPSSDPNITWNPSGEPWWFRYGQSGGTGMWPLLNAQIDQTGKGNVLDTVNKLANIPGMYATTAGNVTNPYYYATDDVVQFMMGVGGSLGSNYSKSLNRVNGIYRMDAVTAQLLADTFTDGLINFMVVGDTFTYNPYPVNSVYNRPYGDWLAKTHGDACQLRIFSENAAGTNQYEIRNYGGLAPSPANPGTPFKAADGTYVEIDIYQPAGSNATVREF
jgi:hypothetical protein